MPQPVQRRLLREAVVQILYSAGSNSSAEATEQEALDLILESYQKKILVTRCKALLHLQQGRGNRLPALKDLARKTFSLDDSVGEQNPLKPIRDLTKAEEALQATLETLRLETKGSKNEGRLLDLLDQCRKHNQESRSAVARLTTPRPALPAVESARQHALDFGQQLTDYSDRLNDSLSERPSELPELAALKKAIDSRKNFGREITTLAEAIQRNLASIDAAIAEAVENYKPERIDRVDRAILRLGAFELLHSEDVPAPVAINEAIELAREFGTTDSPKFVNGVLHQIGSNRPESESAGNL